MRSYLNEVRREMNAPYDAIRKKMATEVEAILKEIQSRKILKGNER